MKRIIRLADRPPGGKPAKWQPAFGWPSVLLLVGLKILVAEVYKIPIGMTVLTSAAVLLISVRVSVLLRFYLARFANRE
jgi:hypothetical protein